MPATARRAPYEWRAAVSTLHVGKELVVGAVDVEDSFSVLRSGPEPGGCGIGELDGELS
jgi:hypothetical protein